MFEIKTLPRSTYIKGFSWAGERLPYGDKDVKGDTFPITWAGDDKLYTSAGDPLWGETTSGIDTEIITGGPEDYKIHKMDPMNDYLGWGGNGPKPTGMICVDDMLYLTVQNLCGAKLPAFTMGSQHGSDVGIIFSNLKYNTRWTPDRANLKVMFNGSKFGGPSFVNFGKNNENARDEYVYAVSSDQWDNGSNMRVGRVHKDCILMPERWEYIVAWNPDGTPVFMSNLGESIPVLSMFRSIGVPEMVYIKGINRYLTFTWRLHKDFSGDDGTDLIVLESPEPWGPFSVVHIEEYWEGKEFTPYCPRVPLKWMADDGKSGYLMFSGSWSPNGQNNFYYRMNVRKFALELF